MKRILKIAACSLIVPAGIVVLVVIIKVWLDYTIMNPHLSDNLGFALSPLGVMVIGIVCGISVSVAISIVGPRRNP